MQSLATPTIQDVVHHDWTRRYFRHLPENPSLEEHLDAPYAFPGTVLEYLSRAPDGLRGALLVARAVTGKGRAPLVVWHGARRLPEETFYGLFGRRFQKISSAAFRLILERTSHVFIANPLTDPEYVVPLPQFARFGVSHRVLEEVVEAKVVVAHDGLFARAAHVPSLRVYAEYPGLRYGDSTRKLFLDRNGQPVPVELVAREALRRFGYDAVPPGVFARLFYAVTDRPASHFRPDHWPGAFMSGRASPLAIADRAAERIRALRDAGLANGIVRSLEALAERPPFRARHVPDGALPLVSRYFTRKGLERFLETVGEQRLLHILLGMLHGYHVVSADWFAWMEGTARVFPCEVKATGDHLRPYQKESILFAQRNGLLDYRLLELLHQRPALPAAPTAANE